MCGTVDQKQLCMEYSCHVWEVVPCWCWIKTDLWDCRSETCCLFWTLSSSSKCSQLKSFLLTYYFGRCTSELDELVPLPPSHNRSTPHSNRLNDFSVTILRCYKNDFDNNFSTRKARFWNFLFAESFSLYYDLKARVTRHL